MMNNVGKNLGTLITRDWWIFLLRGLVAIAFGILTWFLPEVTLATFVFLFGFYALVDGILGTWSAIVYRKQQADSWVFLLIWALISIGIGILTFLAPDVTSFALLFYIAVWAISTGVLQIVNAIRLRKVITNEWWLIIAGLASVVFGVILMSKPGAGALAMLMVIGTYAVIFGILLVILAFEVRSFGKRMLQ